MDIFCRIGLPTLDEQIFRAAWTTPVPLNDEYVIGNYSDPRIWCRVFCLYLIVDFSILYVTDNATIDVTEAFTQPRSLVTWTRQSHSVEFKTQSHVLSVEYMNWIPNAASLKLFLKRIIIVHVYFLPTHSFA